jgi:hypothetical protein
VTQQSVYDKLRVVYLLFVWYSCAISTVFQTFPPACSLTVEWRNKFLGSMSSFLLVWNTGTLVTFLKFSFPSLTIHLTGDMQLSELKGNTVLPVKSVSKLS